MIRIFALPAIALLLSFAPLPGAQAAETGGTSPAKEVWDRHVAAAMSGDVDAIMADFAPDAMIITPDATLAGDAIRQFFADFLADFKPEAMASLTVNSETAHGNVMVSNFTIGAWDQTFHDTAVIEDDRIALLSTVAYPAK